MFHIKMYLFLPTPKVTKKSGGGGTYLGHRVVKVLVVCGFCLYQNGRSLFPNCVYDVVAPRLLVFPPEVCGDLCTD